LPLPHHRLPRRRSAHGGGGPRRRRAQVGLARGEGEPPGELPVTADHFDLIVIGSGAAAASCWDVAARLGKRVAVFESGTLGGECANFACMPTKALLHCAETYEVATGAGRFGIRTGPISVDYGGVKAWKDHVVSRTGAALGEQPYRDRGVTV